jgi:hypothetical protein
MVGVGRLARRGDKPETPPGWRQFTFRESHRKRWIRRAQTEEIRSSVPYPPTATRKRQTPGEVRTERRNDLDIVLSLENYIKQFLFAAPGMGRLTVSYG